MSEKQLRFVDRSGKVLHTEKNSPDIGDWSEHSIDISISEDALKGNLDAESISRDVLPKMRDQLRDRRTIFVIAILPLLLYPLLGMSFLQVAQFMKEHPTRIWILGADRLPDGPPLLDGDGFHSEVLVSPHDTRLLDVKVERNVPVGDIHEVADLAVRNGEYDAVVHFSAAFAQQMRLLTENNENSQHTESTRPEVGPEVFFDQTKDKSRVARDRVVAILSRWRSRIVEQTLAEKSLPARAAKPFRVESQDLSAEDGRQAAMWSKFLPFVVIIWAMTGSSGLREY